MKKTIKLAGVVVIGAAVGFMLWKMLGSVPIILWAAVLGVIPTLIGIEMTFKPPATPKAKGIYRIIFGIWAIATCVLAYLQYKRDEPQIPNLPQITIETFPGLPEGMTNNVHFRFNRLSIRNANDVAFKVFAAVCSYQNQYIRRWKLTLRQAQSLTGTPLLPKRQLAEQELIRS